MSTHSKAAEKFIADKERTAWHNQALWFVREKRDRMARSVPGPVVRPREKGPHGPVRPRMGGPAGGGGPHQDTHHHTSGPLPRDVRAQRHCQRHTRTLGQGRPGAQRDSLRHPQGARSQAPGQEQVHARRGMRPVPLPGGARHRGRRKRPRRAHHAAYAPAYTSRGRKWESSSNAR